MGLNAFLCYFRSFFCHNLFIFVSFYFYFYFLFFNAKNENFYYLQGVDHFKKIQYADGITYGELFSENEYKTNFSDIIFQL